MEVPRLDIKYPEPNDPEYGTATSHYELKALLEWARFTSDYLQHLASTLERELPNELGGRLT